MGDRVEIADRNERRNVDTAELIDDVELVDEVHPTRVEVEVLWRVSLPLFIRNVWAKGGSDESPLVVGHGLSGVVTSRDLRYIVARDAAEPSTTREASHRDNPD